MKILNLYSGIGGNRKLWQGVEVVAVENKKEIAKIYQDFFPNDNVIIADAHEYLLEHYKEFDFIWSSPPCPTHSKMNFLHDIKGIKIKYPDMKLYEEILFLKHFFNGKWIVENVKSYYKPLIQPFETKRHYFWSNFNIQQSNHKSIKIRKDVGMTTERKMNERGILVKNWYGFRGDKRQIINNCIEPEIGLMLLNNAMNIIQNEYIAQTFLNFERIDI